MVNELSIVSGNVHPIQKLLPFEMNSIVDISPEWAEALRNVASRRSKNHYKPAALLLMLDMIDDGEALDGRVPYAAYDKRFEKLMAEVDPEACDQGWQPFLHLTTGEQVWNLYRNGRRADLDELLQRRSRAMLESEVDEARVRPPFDSVFAVSARTAGSPPCDTGSVGIRSDW